MSGRYKLAPSILAADMTTLGRAVEAVTVNGAHYVHFDVMDGHFVPNLSFGIPVLHGIRPLTEKPFDVHLMVSNPAEMIEPFAKAGADILTVHYEAAADIINCLALIKKLGKKAALAIKPSTPVSALFPLAELLDMALVMSVEPGFGGQTLMAETLRKSERLAVFATQHGLAIDIEMDGGIDIHNLRTVLNAGVNVVVAGSAVFNKSPEQTAANTRAFLKVLETYGN